MDRIFEIMMALSMTLTVSKDRVPEDKINYIRWTFDTTLNGKEYRISFIADRTVDPNSIYETLVYPARLALEKQIALDKEEASKEPA